MTHRTRFDRHTLPPDVKDPSTWPAVDVLALKDDKRMAFNRKVRAVRDYVCGKPVHTIVESYKISRNEIIRLTKRCLHPHKDGGIWGERALVSHQHQEKYRRIKPVARKHVYQRGGMAGALSQIFDRYPNIQIIVDQAFLKKRISGVIAESRMPVKSIHKKFIDALRTHGFKEHEYPFNAKYLGIRALSRYLKSLYTRNMRQAVRSRHSAEAAKLLETGDGNNRGVHANAPYRRVEFDGHRMDAIFIIDMPHPQGGTHKVVLRRLWLLFIIDTYTRAVLGYYISLNPEYTDDDVLECIKRAIAPWSPMSLSITGLKYREGSGLPSGIFPRCAWACWSELSYDNARANLSKLVSNNLREFISCAVNPGPVADPTDRPFVERFNQTLEENGFHRLPNTTGCNPKDPRRNKPEEQAVRYEMHQRHIEELVDVLIAEYNATPHSSLGYRSPLELMRLYAEDENFMIRTLEEEKQNKIGRGVLNDQARRKIRGDIKQGRRPYIELEGARYTSDVLARSPEMIGTHLILHINSEDMRTVLACLETGEEFGVLTVQGHWSRTPHNLQTRKTINRLRHRKILFYTEFDDPIHVYLAYLAKEGVKKVRPRAEYARIKACIDQASAIEEPAKQEEIPPPSAPNGTISILKSRLL